MSMLHAQGAGYWHTSGNRILDIDNKQVRIAGINWYGFETGNQVVGGLYAQDYKAILRTVKAQGFNTVRLPFSSEMIESPSSSLNIRFSNSVGPINADLEGLDALQVLDKIVASAADAGLRVILDHHRSEAGTSAQANGLWYTDKYSEAMWIADWVELAVRYRGNANVVGFDLHNEPHSTRDGGACWDCGGAGDWHLAAERAGNAVLAANPHLLIFVEGVDVYQGDAYWWGGNLEGVLHSPVVLSMPNQLVYSAHDYGPREAKQTWFNPDTSYASLASVWKKHWAYISQRNLAPVWISEFGTTNQPADITGGAPGSQGQWFASLVQYLGADRNLNWNYWALNGEDVYGLLDHIDHPDPVSRQKQAMLGSILFPLTTASPAPPPQEELSATSASTGGSGLRWVLMAGSGATFALLFGTGSGDDKTAPTGGTGSGVHRARAPLAGKRWLSRTPATNYENSDIDPAVSDQGALVSLQRAMPPAPAHVTALATSSSQIDLSWSGLSLDDASYNVYSGTCRTKITTPAGLGIPAHHFSVTGLDPASTYYFVIRAVVEPIASISSSIVSATTKVSEDRCVPSAAPFEPAASAMSAT